MAERHIVLTATADDDTSELTFEASDLERAQGLARVLRDQGVEGIKVRLCWANGPRPSEPAPKAPAAPSLPTLADYERHRAQDPEGWGQALAAGTYDHLADA